jgi:hypothetical protein
VREDQDLVSVEVGLPGEGIGERTSIRLVVQLVHPVDVGDPAGAAEATSSTEWAGDPSGPTGRIDHDLGPYGRPVDHDTSRSVLTDHHRVDMTGDHIEARLGDGGVAQRLLEDHSPRPGSHDDGPSRTG